MWWSSCFTLISWYYSVIGIVSFKFVLFVFQRKKYMKATNGGSQININVHSISWSFIFILKNYENRPMKKICMPVNYGTTVSVGQKQNHASQNCRLFNIWNPKRWTVTINVRLMHIWKTEIHILKKFLFQIIHDSYFITNVSMKFQVIILSLKS